ncbi:hypothetical protein D9758_000903 [Tetrapyrgos nigripes]|uniref:Uncharacterized protein n=1 Tax=Tetrapyrgos nigripes TaxID=182062 RepID=A0A8H5LXV9_9AGAR|nr:hypothetical protein D9758_000903 [Tetrapyrgos nigripes]
MVSSHQDGPVVLPEDTPLLGTHPISENHASREFTPVTLIIFPALAYRLATTLPATTTVGIVKNIVCRQYYLSHDPDRIPSSGQMPSELCMDPNVKEIFSGTMTVLMILAALGSMFAISLLNYFTSRHGRKPGLLILIALQMISVSSLILSTYSPPLVELVLLVVFVLGDSISNLTIGTFLINLYIVDVVSSDKRTSTLSSILGWTVTGGAIAFSIGGTLTSRSHNALLVFWVSLTIMFLNFLFVLFIVPESFSKDRRIELRREREEQQAKRASNSRRLDSALGPFQQLKPTINSQTGRRNWRLVLCAVHGFLTELGTSAAVTNMVTYVTAIYDYQASTTGYMMTMVSIVSIVVLTIAIPFAVRRLLPFYKRRYLSSTNQEDPSARDRLDVHVTIFSLVCEGFASILFGRATNIGGHTVALMFWGVGAGRAPVFRSIVAASVEPLKQGSTLSAVELVSSVGSSISPMMMGSILTATIATMPSFVFSINALIIFLASSVLLFIRESDRYRKPDEDSE